MRHTASAQPRRLGKTQASEIHFDGNPVSVLHLFHHKDAVEIAYAVDVAEFLAHELLIRLHVPCLYLQGEVVFAAGVIAFRYLINVLDGSHEIVHKHLGMVFKAHVAQNGDAVVCLFGIEYGMIALYEALTFQTLLAVKSGGSGEIHLHGKLFHGEGTVLLKQLQYLAVDGIEFRKFHIKPNNILIKQIKQAQK